MDKEGTRKPPRLAIPPTDSPVPSILDAVARKIVESAKNATPKAIDHQRGVSQYKEWAYPWMGWDMWDG